MEKYTRNCPVCGKKLFYQRPGKLQLAIKYNSKCNSCGQKGRKFSEEHKQKLSC
jgi:endogenous inhibitor of DNA gyrase (YacG/DUF329 family)